MVASIRTRGRAGGGDAGETDRDCLARIARGDLGALGDLYDRHAGSVHRFVARATCGASDAPDIVQDTFVSVITAAPRYDDRLACRPWLFGIAANHLLHRRRATARLRRFLERLVLAPTAVDDGVRRLESRDAMDLTAHALSTLAPHLRVALIMTEIEGMSGEEASAALGIPAGTVWRHVHEARAGLRRAFAQEKKR